MGEETFTYTKQELLEAETAFEKLAQAMIDPILSVSQRDRIIAFDEFHQAFRKLVPNTLWKGADHAE